MMATKGKLSIALSWITFCSIPLFVFILILVLIPDQPKALSGHSQVDEIDLFWNPGSEVITARVHLATGIALTYDAKDEKESDMLIEFAQIFSSGKSRLYVEIEKDKIKTFQVSAFVSMPRH